MAGHPIRITRGLRFGPPELRVAFASEQRDQADVLRAIALDAGLTVERGRRGYASRPGENVTEEFVAFPGAAVDIHVVAAVLQAFFESNKGQSAQFGKSDVIHGAEQLSEDEIVSLLSPLGGGRS